MKISQISHFIFDFDGVLTDNRVFIGENPDSEFVVCNRADGLAFDAIRKLDINCFIVSTDKSLASKTRASLCRFSACPSDSHSEVKKSCSFILKTNGGKGVVREILEDIFKLNLAKILYE